MTKIVITKELQDTVKGQPSITKVYFDEFGNHYFNVHKLPKSKDDKTKPEEYDMYGKGLESHRRVIPGIFNIDRITEQISKGDPATKIVKVFTREEVLSANVKPVGDSLIAKVANMTDADREALRIMLTNGNPAAPAAPAASQNEQTTDEGEKVI